MTFFRARTICLALAVQALAACGAINPPDGPANAAPANLPIAELSLPAGFEVSVYARVATPRQMALSPDGTLFVGTRDGAGAVFAVVDRDKDGRAEEVLSIASNLRSPNGVEFRDGSLYVAEISRITRYDNIEGHLKNPPKPVLVTDKYPTDGHHGWKYIRFGPDGKLYVPIGAPCNVCERKDPRYATITRINKDGSGFEIFASGVRNTVGFDWEPITKELWFTDNGRDWLGDDRPYDELNHAPKAGMHFGFPYCHGKGISDPDFGKKRPCTDFSPAAFELGPHVAALGMKFYTGTMFPADYRGDIIYAEHGSWNRSEKSGYRVMRVHMEEGKPARLEPLVTGFVRKNGSVWGRPVDVVVMKDGSLLVSDDFASAIYRITYKGPSRNLLMQPSP